MIAQRITSIWRLALWQVHGLLGLPGIILPGILASFRWMRLLLPDLSDVITWTRSGCGRRHGQAGRRQGRRAGGVPDAEQRSAEGDRPGVHGRRVLRSRRPAAGEVRDGAAGRGGRRAGVRGGRRVRVRAPERLQRPGGAGGRRAGRADPGQARAQGRASPPFVLVPGRTGSGADRDGPACGIAAAWRSPAQGPAGSWASQDAIPRAASTGSWYRQPPPAPASAIARSAS